MNNIENKILIKCPIDGKLIGEFTKHSKSEISEILEKSQEAFEDWRKIPPPKRGELIRLFGNILRKEKENLAKLITLETGKPFQESLGEVQEGIDMAEFSFGMSRQLEGKIFPSERPDHIIRENWHPIGPIAIITAFNFPVAVYMWNLLPALVTGNACIWKPSEKTLLVSSEIQKLLDQICQKFDYVPSNLVQLVISDYEGSIDLIDNDIIKLVSATGSTRMGKEISKVCAQRLTRTLLELGGNNGSILCQNADINLALRGIVFSSIGTNGQRCTTLRRLFVHVDIYDQVVLKLKEIYSTILVGDPYDGKNLMGPLIDKQAYDKMQAAVMEARHQLAISVTGGERILKDEYPDSFYVNPCLIEMPHQTSIVKEETFAPILYIMPYKNLDQAIEILNDTEYGLSSSIFTRDLREAELFQKESINGLISINSGTSGAEVGGGSFGGEKLTGGGRESGWDCWKNYMRRSTNVINYSDTLPLAQGIKFDI